jgi:Icc-related predicted phosphoesterase
MFNSSNDDDNMVDMPKPYPGRTIQLDTMIQNNTIILIHTSDTHNLHETQKIPPGDIYIHSGDFSHKNDWDIDITGIPQSVQKFNQYLGTLPHKVKIVIAGNHEIGFNDHTSEYIQKNIITNAIYLQDEALRVILPNKHYIKFYGTPWTTSSNMGFSMNRHIIPNKWSMIPDDTDILITHLPPQGIMDCANGNTIGVCSICGRKDHPYKRHWGCPELRKKVEQLCAERNLKVHLFGHVHEDWGKMQSIIEGRKMLYCNGAADNNSVTARPPHVLTLRL